MYNAHPIGYFSLSHFILQSSNLTTQLLWGKSNEFPKRFDELWKNVKSLRQWKEVVKNLSTAFQNSMNKQKYEKQMNHVMRDLQKVKKEEKKQMMFMRRALLHLYGGNILEAKEDLLKKPLQDSFLYHLLLAVIYDSLCDYTTAVKEAEFAIENFNNDDRLQTIVCGKHSSDYLEKWLELDEMYNLCGCLCYKAFEYQKAIQYLSTAIQLLEQKKQSEKAGKLFYNRGLCYLFLHETHAALSDFTASIHSGCQLAEIYANRALLLQRSMRIENSISDRKKAIELDPKCKPIELFYHLELDEELTKYLFSFLGVQEMGRIAQTCKYWNFLIQDPALWEDKIIYLWCPEENDTTRKDAFPYIENILKQPRLTSIKHVIIPGPHYLFSPRIEYEHGKFAVTEKEEIKEEKRDACLKLLYHIIDCFSRIETLEIGFIGSVDPSSKHTICDKDFGVGLASLIRRCTALNHIEISHVVWDNATRKDNFADVCPLPISCRVEKEVVRNAGKLNQEKVKGRIMCYTW